ncbi:MAG: SMP-30/Gluconolaconase/LRE-like region [Planctomycetaceae bacterium]|nr:SMP-30/Gluconolaconase/LRE-like region [Planctomycetaceae bacterium]
MRGTIRRSRFFCSLCIAITLLVGSAIQPQFGLAASEESVTASTKSAPATHKQQKVISVANTKAGEKLEDFCVDADGRIFALLAPAGPNDGGGVSLLGALFGAKPSAKKGPPFACAVHVFDADGKLSEKWPVEFSGQAISTAPDGTILVGGDGRVARFDVHGKKLLEAESPQMTYINKNPEEMRARAKEQLESDRATYSEQVKQFEEQLLELKKSKKAPKDSKKPAKDEAADESEFDIRTNEQSLKQMVSLYKQQLQVLEKKTVEETLQEVLMGAKRTHSLSASDKDVFVTCPAMAGYGYGVWRTDEKFGQAKEIVKSLSGCCGQMDVQCRNGELYVCENSRHRVVRFNREGKIVSEFGKRDREGEGENFGGCCNPMNLCFSKDGNLYVSESNGAVKHFTPDGKYLGMVGVAKVDAGCKNSCVAVTADDSRLYYIDINKSQIIVLARNDDAAKKSQ